MFCIPAMDKEPVNEIGSISPERKHHVADKPTIYKTSTLREFVDHAPRLAGELQFVYLIGQNFGRQKCRKSSLLPKIVSAEILSEKVSCS